MDYYTEDDLWLHLKKVFYIIVYLFIGRWMFDLGWMIVENPDLGSSDISNYFGDLLFLYSAFYLIWTAYHVPDRDIRHILISIVTSLAGFLYSRWLLSHLPRYYKFAGDLFGIFLIFRGWHDLKLVKLLKKYRMAHQLTQSYAICFLVLGVWLFLARHIFPNIVVYLTYGLALMVSALVLLLSLWVNYPYWVAFEPVYFTNGSPFSLPWRGQ